MTDHLTDNSTHLDFDQARAKHLLFKSRLRSILYGLDVDETPVLSHYECAVGKWIYNHALQQYNHIPEIHELEKVHADIHTSARELVRLYKENKIEEARNGLEGMEKIADRLIQLLSEAEKKVKQNPLKEINEAVSSPSADVEELANLQKAKSELHEKIRLREKK